MARISPSNRETGAIKAGASLTVTPQSSAIVSIFNGDVEESKVAVSSSVQFGPYLSNKKFSITALGSYAEYTVGLAEYENGRQYPSLSNLISGTDAPIGSGEVRQFGGIVYREVAGETLDRDTFRISSGARLKLADGFVSNPVSRIYSVDRAAALSSSNPAPIDQIDGVLYGYFSDVIYKSTDDGDSWALVADVGSTGGEVKRILPCRGGEVLVLRDTALIKSVDWPSPSDWETKISLAEGQFIEWSLDGNGTKFILADYGVPYTTSNYMWISLDGGNSWTQYEKNTLHPGNDAGAHFHGVAYDHIDDRFWHCMGDNTYRGHYYSDDDGATWSEVTLGRGMLGTVAQAATISTTPHGMVLGSDSGINGGMYRILRRDTPSDMRVEMMWRWPNELTSVRGFPFKSIYDPVSGITFMCWRSDVTGNPPFITWSNGITGGILYEWEGSWSANDGIRNIVVLPSGTVKAWISLASADEEVLTFKYTQSISSPYSEDAGLIRGGSVSGVDNNCMAVGQVASAVGSTIAVGPGCTSSSFGAVSVGVKATAGANDIAIGYNAVVGGTNGVAIGRDATANGNQAVVIGSLSSSNYDRSVLIGQQIVDTGTQNVLIGYDVDVTSAGTWNVVIGAFADADSSSNVVVGRIAKSQGTRGTAIGAFADTITKGVAIGYAAVCDTADSVAIGDSTNTDIPSSVAIGPRDLHVQNATKGVILTSPNGTKYRITVDDAGALSTAVVA